MQGGNKKGSGDYLPPVDHSLVDYEEFAKVSRHIVTWGNALTSLPPLLLCSLLFLLD
jgi:hypothetical protein